MQSINESLRDPAKVLFHLMPTQQELETVPCCDGVLFVTLVEVSFPSTGSSLTSPAVPGGRGSSSRLLTGVSDYL